MKHERNLQLWPLIAAMAVKKRYFPSIKIGKRVFVDPVMVRKALDANFTIPAT